MLLGCVRYCYIYHFAYKAVTFYGCPFQNNSALIDKHNAKTVFFAYLHPTTSKSQRTQAWTWFKFRLFPFRSPLLRESLCFLFLALLRCFSSCRSPFYLMNSDKNTLVLPKWISPFGNLRINAWLTAPRSFWQSSASFIVSWYQGIHQMPFSINHKFAGYPLFEYLIYKNFKEHKKNFYYYTSKIIHKKTN